MKPIQTRMNNGLTYVAALISLTLIITLIHCDSTENEPDYSLIGSWDLSNGFSPTSPHMINFYSSGYYTVYSSCESGLTTSEPLEIGTYEVSKDELKITSHLQNGCGGFDDDENPDQIPPGPVSLGFDNEGDVAIIAGGLRLTRIVDEAQPIVGSWELPEGFNPDRPHIITFYNSGHYVVYTDCSNEEAPTPNEPLEIGTYTATATELTIASHLQNGCGGFDDPEDVSSPPTGAISIQLSEDGNTLTLVNDNLTLTRIR